MAGFTPNEGEDHILGKVYVNGDLHIMLITNSVALDETAVFSDLVEPTGGGYSRQSLSGWSISGQQATHPKVTFTATATDYTPAITGYALKDATTDTIIHIEFSGTSVTVLSGGTYDVDLSNTLD